MIICQRVTLSRVNFSLWCKLYSEIIIRVVSNRIPGSRCKIGLVSNLFETQLKRLTTVALDAVSVATDLTRPGELRSRVTLVSRTSRFVTGTQRLPLSLHS